MSAVTWRMERPNAKQDAVMRLRNPFIAYGGARGGGKSWLVRTWSTLMCLKKPGIKALIIRGTYSELEKNHIRPLREMTHGFARYNDQKKTLTFTNGSTIQFGYCLSEKDMERYQGGEWDLIFIDEASNIPEICIKKFIPCMRGVNDFPKRTVYTLNPGGRSHFYFKRLFVDRDFHADEDPGDYAFVQALVQDNTALKRKMPDYVKQLETLPEKLKKAWLYGEWDVFAGQFFEDFVNLPRADRVNTHVIPPFTPPAHWRIYRTYDYGYDKPFACQWWAIDNDGVMYLILELYGCGKEPNEGLHWNADKQFDEIARIEREHPWLKGKRIQGVADPAIWGKESTGMSVADTAAKHGVQFTPGDHDRLNGWAQCHNRLAFDQNGRPMMYVFEDCTAFRRTIPTLLYDENKPEDLDTDGEDHEADAWRYLCMLNPIKAPVVRQKKIVVPHMDPMELYESTRRTMRR